MGIVGCDELGMKVEEMRIEEAKCEEVLWRELRRELAMAGLESGDAKGRIPLREVCRGGVSE